MPEPELKSFYALVTALPDGSEILQYAESGKAIVPLVSTDPNALNQFQDSATMKAAEKGGILRVIQFDRVKAVDIGGPNTPEVEEPT
jgi:hypothetical protein